LKILTSRKEKKKEEEKGDILENHKKIMLDKQELLERQGRMGGTIQGEGKV